MPSFDSGSAVEAVKWDFSAYLGENVKGTFEEPSADALDEFNSAAFEMLGDGALEPEKIASIQQMLGANPSEADVLSAGLALLPDLDEDTLKELRGLQLKRVKRLCERCDGAPSPEQIDSLPGRVQEAFAGYVQGSFGADPTQLQPSASTSSLAGVNGAAPTT
jgi:hypothetical protein